ncbi:substrate-binding periplasmic protein [Nitrincola sp. MINF-07-Sa-05]|uniref:substrate-binding periplasmic protein n=1 Tax=Nitrincola salilacus TaxID=3400273 RepID=UPI003917BACB
MRFRLITLTCLLLTFTAVQADEYIVSVATLTDYPPLIFNKPDATGKVEELIPPGQDSSSLQGYSWDILRESYHSQGYTIQIYVAPWTRAFEMARSDSVDILFPTGYNEDRAEYFHYSVNPINEASFIIYTLPDKALEWEGLTSLDKLTLGAMRGWNYGTEWEQAEGFYKYELSDILQGFQMLDAGRIDGLAGYETNFDYALSEAGLPNIYTKHPAFGETFEYATASKSHPTGGDMLKVFDLGVEHLKASGRLREIRQHWFPGVIEWE